MRRPPIRRIVLLAGLILGFSAGSLAQPADFIAANFVKTEEKIPMRDGVHLFTAVYRPKESKATLPILMLRTPYSVAPYGVDKMRTNLGPSPEMTSAGYIFVYQDVRGRFLSEGSWQMMTPHRATKSGKEDVDESTDTFDTISWLLEHVPGNNGRVGMWGISYPGYYALAGAIDAHPALKAISPQAPPVDMFLGDDFHHHGAFFLSHAFRWLSNNARERSGPTTERAPALFDYGTPDGYRFFLNFGVIAEADTRWLKGQVPAWREYMAHPNYDEYWKAQALLPHLKDMKPAILHVGGWFDSEDLHGPLKAYQRIEASSKECANHLVMGPWIHGGWARSAGDRLGAVPFGSNTAEHYRQNIEARFFRELLLGDGKSTLPEAMIFETGSNRWREESAWPPKGSRPLALHLHPGGALAFTAPPAQNARFDEWISDPAKPVPFTAEIRNTMGHEFMIEDQRFAWTRPDVMSYESKPLEEEISLVGPLTAELTISTSGTDADFIVKLIDVFPGNTETSSTTSPATSLGHYQMLVRGEVFRARYRNSYETPEPLVPDEVTQLRFELQDVAHCFKAGHRIMIQVQSTWFPLVDRNPQAFVDPYTADPATFRSQAHRLYAGRVHALRAP